MTALALAPDTTISYEPAAAAGADRAIRVSTAVAILAVAGVAAYVSYWHAYAVVCAHGETGLTARLEPATIDGLGQEPDAGQGNLTGPVAGLTPRGADGPPPVRRMTGAGQAGGPDWNAAGHADQMADQPSGSPGPVTAASPGCDTNGAAVAAYRASLQAGRPLSERKLAGQFGKTSRRWARSRMAEARQSPSPA
jgi:hypothetical protein